MSQPVDLNTGYDLLTPEGRSAVDKIIEKDDPFAISFAPVCTPWTSWTNILTGNAIRGFLPQGAKGRWDNRANRMRQGGSMRLWTL